ncbi:xanthine phosphoribosyltransferase [Formicincola oecophyllae]|uniref:Xanthine phosphoribosyltransferase n=1 Tax=Formicincola oecophyllae TaxID=2558361 RepID=A0A4Y6U6N0_9PROT|nr:xanthine phosphoribosyltransferase [Formicincola oecophyllae]QDH13019.1 xanthine phosphoribosyltransferase [Formicincola oecophyllae]
MSSPNTVSSAPAHAPEASAPDYATITWDQLHRDARTLAATLMRECSQNGAIKGLVAISRGGLIPAAIVARETGSRLVETVCIASYEGEEGTQGEPNLLKAPVAAGDGEGFVVIDDLVDSGVTAKEVRALLPKAVFACLYAKPKGQPQTDYYVTPIAQKTWVLFPWDTAPMFVAPLAHKS